LLCSSCPFLTRELREQEKAESNFSLSLYICSGSSCVLSRPEVLTDRIMDMNAPQNVSSKKMLKKTVHRPFILFL